ncbi:MAG: hypothetical protein AB7I50_13985 [Vicinamibacterales bacterium]
MRVDPARLDAMRPRPAGDLGYQRLAGAILQHALDAWRAAGCPPEGHDWHFLTEPDSGLALWCGLLGVDADLIRSHVRREARPPNARRL